MIFVRIFYAYHAGRGSVNCAEIDGDRQNNLEKVASEKKKHVVDH